MPLAHAKRWLYSLCLALICLGNASTTTLAQATAQDRLFDFHSGFWINLHHFLYRQAQMSMAQNGRHPITLVQADTDTLQQLSASERRSWNEAVSYYAQFAKRDLLFDDELIQIKNQLEDAEDSPDLKGAPIPPALKAVLLKAAPVYRKHWWPRHNTQNREWIAHLQPLVMRYGPALSAQMARIYGEPWPGSPVRVDAVAYANWAGAYTTVDPTRPAISTTDPANQDTAALEILFHETSHGMMRQVMNAMNAAEKSAQGSGMAFHSGSIWHAVLFYTAGELVAKQVPGYIPYADKNGLWVRAWPAPDRALIEQDWEPHIEGAASLQESLTKLVADLASAAQPH